MATNAVVTKKGKEKIIRARAGDISLPRIRWMSFGSGGVDAGGAVIPTEESETSLKEEVIKIEITEHKIQDTTCTYTCRIEADQAVGKKISELALVDSDGDLIAIKRFLPKQKDAGMPMIFEVEDKIL